VRAGVAGGFCQICHGKAVRRLRSGDRIVYYSPTTRMRGGEPVQAFTAIGLVEGGEPYSCDMGGGFVPFRRPVAFLEASEARSVRSCLGSRLPRAELLRATLSGAARLQSRRSTIGSSPARWASQTTSIR